MLKIPGVVADRQMLKGFVATKRKIFVKFFKLIYFYGKKKNLIIFVLFLVNQKKVVQKLIKKIIFFKQNVFDAKLHK